VSGLPDACLVARWAVTRNRFVSGSFAREDRPGTFTPYISGLAEEQGSVTVDSHMSGFVEVRPAN